MMTHCAKPALVILPMIWLSGALAQRPASAGYESPLASVNALHVGLIAAARSEPNSIGRRYEQLAPLISETHDLPFIAQFATRRYWDGFDAAQRETFIEKFARLSSMTYAARFRTVSTETFSIESTKILDSGRAMVTATIRRDAQPAIPIEYLLHETAAGWKIINVIADGVSDLALKRAEYRAVLEDGNPDDLLSLLDEQIAAL